MLWQRELTLVLGGSVYSTTIILMAYMSGLALGNFWAGKLMTRFRQEYRLLAWIQVTIGIFIFIFPLLLIGVDTVSDFLFPLSARHHIFYLFIKALIALLVLLVPSSLIGACFPVLVSLFERIKVSRNIFIGKLNFLNSLGSVLGALMTGFVLIYFLGARTSLTLAGALFVLSGILVLGISLRKPPATDIPGSPVPESGSRPEKLVMDIPLKPAVMRSLLILLFFCSGFTALSYELLYNRILVYFLGNTTFSFTLIVSFFILGYSLGSFIFYKFMNQNKKISRFLNSFVLLQFIIALYHLLLPVFLPLLHHMMIGLKANLLKAQGDKLLVEFFIRFLSAFLILILPALCFGIIFPLVYRIYFGSLKDQTSKKALGKTFGKINAINTLGSVSGPLLTGFLLIATFQISPTLRLISVLNILIGLVFLVPVATRGESRKAAIVKILLVLVAWSGLVVSLPVQNQLGIQAARQSEADSILFYREGVFGTVSVSINPRNIKILKINGVGEVPTDYDSMRAFRMLAYLPFMIHDNPRSLLSIAFGGGITFGSIANTRLPRMKCVEICKDVLDAAHLYEQENNRVISREKGNILVRDGRTYIRNTRETFDIITSDATHPASFDSWVLYTEEFYRSCSKKLNRGGIMAQWIPLHGLSVSDYQSVLKTFASVFDYTQLYLANAYSIIIGSQEPLDLKPENFIKWTSRESRIRTELRDIHITTLSDLNHCLLLSGASLRQFAATGTVSRDAFSPLQFAELRSLNRENTLEDNLSALLKFRQQHHLKNPRLDAYLNARILAERGEIPQALEFIETLDKGVKSPEVQELKHRILLEIAIKRTPELLKNKNTTTIIDTLKNYSERFPGEGYFQSLLGYVYFKQGQHQEAGDMIRTSIRLSPWNRSVQKIALNVLSSLSDHTGTLEAVQNLLRMDPGNQKYTNLQAEIRAKTGRHSTEK